MVEELTTDMYMLKGNMEELDRKAVKLSQEYITTCDNMAEYKTNIFKVIDDLKLELKTTSDSQASMNKDVSILGIFENFCFVKICKKSERKGSKSKKIVKIFQT